MNMKVIWAALAATVVSFFLGWLVFGMLLDPYYKAHMIVHPGLMKLMPHMLPLIVSNLSFGVLIAWVLGRMGASSLMAGAMAGAIISMLMAISFDMFMYGFMNMFADKMVVIVDVIANAVVGAIVGAVAGLVLGMGSKNASA